MIKISLMLKLLIIFNLNLLIFPPLPYGLRYQYDYQVEKSEKYCSTSHNVTTISKISSQGDVTGCDGSNNCAKGVG